MVTKVKIYQPAKTAMQSGKRRTKRWVLELMPDASPYVEPLMGWTGAKDTVRQVKLEFATKDAAIAYAAANQLDYVVIEPKNAATPPKNYSANFGFTRVKAF